jgi:hypothetical protein
MPNASPPVKAKVKRLSQAAMETRIFQQDKQERAVARKPLLLQMILKSTFWLPT